MGPIERGVFLQRTFADRAVANDFIRGSLINGFVPLVEVVEDSVVVTTRSDAGTPDVLVSLGHSEIPIVRVGFVDDDIPEGAKILEFVKPRTIMGLGHITAVAGQ